jgi:hypothetical protein
LFTLQDVDLSLVHVAVRRHVLGASGSGHDQSSYDGRDRGGERTRPRSGSTAVSTNDRSAFARVNKRQVGVPRREQTTGRRSQA